METERRKHSPPGGTRGQQEQTQRRVSSGNVLGRANFSDQDMGVCGRSKEVGKHFGTLSVVRGLYRTQELGQVLGDSGKVLEQASDT